MLSVVDLCAGYSKSDVLRSVCLQIPNQGITAIVGPNGAGKSTLFKVVAGDRSVSIHSGAVTWNDVSVIRRSTAALARQGLAYVAEGGRVFRSMTVAENLELGGLALGRRPKSPEFKAIYELFPILRQRELQMAGTLSGGEQHMLAIGRALMARPVMLLLDEPTGGLAPIVVEQVRHGIGLLAEQGIAVVIAEQNLDLVDHMDCKTHLIDRGVVKWSGMSGKLRQIPAVVDAILGSKRDRERRLGATTTRPESGHHTPEQ